MPGRDNPPSTYVPPPPLHSINIHNTNKYLSIYITLLYIYILALFSWTFLWFLMIIFLFLFRFCVCFPILLQLLLLPLPFPLDVLYIYIWYISQYTLTRFLFPQFQQKCFSFWLKRVLGLVNCYTGISVIHKHTHTRTPRKNIEIQLSLSNLLFDSLRLFISLSLSVLHSQLFYCYTVYMIFCSFEFVREFPHSFYIYKYTRFFVTV